MDRRSWIAAAGLAAVAGGFLLPGSASAVELYWTPNGQVITGQPLQVLTVQPTPARYVLQPASTTVTLAVRTPPPTVVYDDGSDDGDIGDHDAFDDPYETGGIVVAGAGMGGLFVLGDGVTEVAAAYRLHLGLAVGRAEFALRFDLAPDALDVPAPSGAETPAALYTTGASFNYRFLPRAVVHPVAGVGLESIIIDPHEGDTGNAFAVTARAGIELAYPLSDGALALGIDATGHHPFGATDEYDAALTDMLTFGAYADYRF